MTRTYVCAIALAVLWPASSIAQGENLPQVLSLGATEYRQRGTSAAVRAWLSNSALARDSSLVSRTIASLREVEGAFGHFVALEPVATARIGSRVVRTYAALLYENGPLFVYFDTYRVSEKVIVTGFLFNAKPDAILPSRLLGG